MKKPISVLVLIHTPDLQILLLERTAHPGFWQSVTGSQEDGESLRETAQREVQEETGLTLPIEHFQPWPIQNRFEIYPIWRDRYPPGVTHNTEHVFSLCIPSTQPVILAPTEHSHQIWLPLEQAAQQCFSWTNKDAILMLPHHTQHKLTIKQT